MLLVFGSINADLVFRVAHLPRPGETVLCPGYAVAAGGKGANQAAAAAKAGGSVRMVGRTGDDDHGRAMRDGLRAAGVDIGGIARSSLPTGVAVIAVDERGENSILVASGANGTVDAAQVEDEALAPGVTLLCQNEVPAEATFALLRRARAKGARTILNMAPAGTLPAEVLQALDVLLVNEIEAATIAGRDDAPAVLARELAGRFDLACVVTLGRDGAIAASGSRTLAIGVLPVLPVDTTGAGDTFAGVLAAALDRGLPLPDALRRASVAAALACTALGAQTSQPDAHAIALRLNELPPARPLA